MNQTFKTSKTLNFKENFKYLFESKTMKEEKETENEKIKQFKSEKLDLNKLKTNKLSSLSINQIKQPQTMRTIKYIKYSPLTTIYSEIERAKREIESYMKEGKKVCASIEKKKIENYKKSFHSPQITQYGKSKRKMFLTQSTFYETPQIKKTRNVFSNDIQAPNTERKSIINVNDLKKIINNKKNEKVKNYNLTTINNNNEEEKNSRKTSISIKDKYNTVEVNKGRMKSFVVNYIPKWHFKNEYINIKASKEIIKSSDFQKNIFYDEISVLLDNLNIYKKKFIMNEGLCYYFYNTTLKNQRIINKLLEETCGLLIEISYLLLNDYAEDIDKFVANVQEKPNSKDDKYVENENEEFKINIKKFIECCNFIKICFDCYDNILLYDKLCLLNTKNFYTIMQYLKRARLNSGQLKYFTENIFNNFNNDDKIVNRFLKEMKIYKLKAKGKKVYKKKKNKEADFYNYKGPIILKETRENDKIKRINIALDKNFSKTEQNYHPKHLNFNSRLVSGLLKYATENFRSEILSERIIQRFKEREREENLNLDIQ